MQSDNNLRETDSGEARRKRVNRIKKMIMIGAFLLVLLPTICCIILGMQLNRLQKQVDKLTVMYGTNQTSESTGDGLYAYAAVKTDGSSDNQPNQNNPAEDDQYSTSDNINSESADKTAEEQPSEDIPTVVPSGEVNAESDSITKDNTVTDAEAENDKNTDGDNDTAKGIYAGKKVYLTFDDGPSEYTDEILDTLAKYNVKATFFVIGKTDDKSKELYQRIVKEGHTLGMHSYSHKYEKIYNSVEDFDKDFTKLWKLLYDTTGYKPTIYRFPGGSDNLVNNHGMDEFIKYLNEKSIVYFDWNVVNGDATGTNYTQKRLVNNILSGIENKERSIVLMHDSQTKKSTIDSLPELLKTLIRGDAQILPLDDTVAPIQMIKADTVK